MQLLEDEVLDLGTREEFFNSLLLALPELTNELAIRNSNEKMPRHPIRTSPAGFVFAR